jgi:Protein of unknown function (DUF2490)
MKPNGRWTRVRQLIAVVVFCLTSAVGGEIAWAVPNHDGQVWVPIYNRFTLSENFQGWFEVNPRFGDNMSEIDQLLIRPALGYQLTPNLSLWQGYGWITNYQPNFRDEHRLYQEISYRPNLSGLRILSRTRLEERFVRSAVGIALRAREMLRVDFPIGREGIWGLVVYDELFVNLNTIKRGPQSGFDQNRLFVGVHRKVNALLSFDFGYQNQSINTSGQHLIDKMNHIMLIQWFIDWGNL